MDTELFTLLNDFNDLTISNDDDEDFEDVNLNENYDETPNNLPVKYNDLIEAVFGIINKDPTFTAEIVDNVIILDNILFGLNPQLDDEAVSIKAILRLSEFHKRKIPQRNDPSWWEEKCSKFEDLMIHLRNCSTSNDFKINEKNEEILIKNEIVDFASKIVQKDYEFKGAVNINTNLLDMYKIAKYLECYFYKKVGSFYSEEMQFTNEYFEEFREYVLENLCNIDSKPYSCYLDLYLKYINQALLKVLRGAQNMLILFGPYGYDALSSNYDILDLNLHEIFEFRKEALEYFALNNLIELKLHDKKINLNNPNDYVNLIFRGASLV
jgi:hypothetical protein